MTHDCLRRTAGIIAVLAFCFHVTASAQVRHGTAVIAIRHGNTLVVAADSLEVASRQTDTSACKIFTSGDSVFALAGIGGIGTVKFADFFQRDPAFATPSDEATFRQSAERWATDVLAILNTHFGEFPQEYWALRKADRSTVAIFAEVTSSGKLILLQERVHDDPARARSFPYFVADSRVIAIDETLVMGAGSIDTYTEMHAAATPRALAAQSLLHALEHPTSFTSALQTAQSFIATTKTWRPNESGGDISELALSPAGLVWTNHTPACR